MKIPVEGVEIWFQEQGYLDFRILEEPTCGPGTKYAQYAQYPIRGGGVGVT